MSTASALPAIIIPVVLVLFIAILLLGTGTLMFFAYSKKKDFWPSSFKKTGQAESGCFRPDPVGKEQNPKNPRESVNEPENIYFVEQASNESDGDADSANV